MTSWADRTHTRDWILFALRVAAGLFGLAILLVRPERGLVFWTLLIVSTAGLLKDARLSARLNLIILGINIFFILFGFWAFWTWFVVGSELPPWARERVPPVWARIAICVTWVSLMWWHFRQVTLLHRSEPAA